MNLKSGDFVLIKNKEWFINTYSLDTDIGWFLDNCKLFSMIVEVKTVHKGFFSTCEADGFSFYEDEYIKISDFKFKKLKEIL
jgi:hypothetical protein